MDNSVGNVIGIVGLLVGCLGAFFSGLSLHRIKKVNEALGEFKKELMNKKKTRARIESFNYGKNGIHKKVRKLMTRVEKGTVSQDLTFSAELNQVVAIIKNMFSYKDLFDLAGISEDDLKAFEEFVDMVQQYNNTGEGDLNGKMIECIKRLELICIRKDIDNEL